MAFAQAVEDRQEAARVEAERAAEQQQKDAQDAEERAAAVCQHDISGTMLRAIFMVAVDPGKREGCLRARNSLA